MKWAEKQKKGSAARDVREKSEVRGDNENQSSEFRGVNSANTAKRKKKMKSKKWPLDLDKVMRGHFT